MHVLQYILVEAHDARSALEKADAVASSASWSDWHQVGGRWDGAIEERFPAIAPRLEHPNVLPVWEFRNEAHIILTEATKRQDRAFLESRDALVGNPVAASDVDGHIFGLPVADSAATAQRMSESNARSAHEWESILHSNSLVEAMNNGYMAVYHARRIINLVDGIWESDSAFYDGVSDTCRPEYLRQALAGETQSQYRPDSPLFIVPVDFHY